MNKLVFEFLSSDGRYLKESFNKIEMLETLPQLTKKITQVEILNMGIKTFIKPEEIIKACSKANGLKLYIRVNLFYFTQSDIKKIKNSLSKD